MPNKMTLRVFIHEIDDTVLIKLCNELYDYKYVSGKLPPDGVINTLTNGFEEWDLEKLEKSKLVKINKFQLSEDLFCHIICVNKFYDKMRTCIRRRKI